MFVKDLFNKHGQFLSERYVMYNLKNTSNWVAEYFVLKNIFIKYVIHRFNPLECQYIQPCILNNAKFYINGKLTELTDIKSKEIYTALISKKFHRPYTERMWQKRLNIEITPERWKDIYFENIKVIKYKKFSEFKFKVLHNILTNRQALSKWKINISPNCAYCGQLENVCHLLYFCPRVKQIWQNVGECLKMYIQLKHIILGIPNHNYVCENKMTCITIISYAMYSYWCMCINEEEKKAKYIKDHINQTLSFYVEVYKHVLEGQQRQNLICMMKCISNNIK